MTSPEPKELEQKLRRRAASETKYVSATIKRMLPTIQALRAEGHTLRQIAKWLTDEGVSIKQSYLSTLVSRFQKDAKPGTPPTTMVRPAELRTGGFRHEAASTKGVI